MSYARLVTDRLLELRAGGVRRFDAAWRQVMVELPAPGTWKPRGVTRGTEAPLTFLKRQCRDAWEGTGIPINVDLGGLLVRDTGGVTRRGRIGGSNGRTS